MAAAVECRYPYGGGDYYCRRPAAPGRKHCRRHLDMRRRITAKHSRRIQESGRCLICLDRPPAAGKTLCADCSGRRNAVAAARRQAFIDAGLCPKCPKHRPVTDTILCDLCRLKSAEWAAEIRRRKAEGFRLLGPPKAATRKVNQIKAMLESGYTCRQIASKFEIHSDVVKAIRDGGRHNRKAGHSRLPKFDAAQIEAIRQGKAAGKSYRVLALEFDVAIGTIVNICTYRTYKD